jgi:hypothetical protein
MGWPTVVSIGGEAVQRLRLGAGIVIGGGIRSISTTKWVYVYLAILLADFLLLVIFVTAAGIMFAGEPRSGGKKDHSASAKAGRLLYAGIAILVVGLAVKWIDFHIEQQTYGMTIGSYFVVGGAVLILLWHLLTPDLFIVGSAMAMAVIFFIQGATYASLVLNFAVWLPVSGLAVASFSLTQVERNLRIASLGMPIILATFAICPSTLQVPLGLHFSVYHKPTSERPPDFPEYLEAPIGANGVTYTGGNRPYLCFTVEDPYPASKTLAFLAANLQKAGWKKLEYNLMAPESESSHLKGWYSPLEQWFGPIDPNEEAKSDRKRCLWNASWINQRDETVHAWLAYRLSEEGKTDWTKLHCSISVSQADPAQLMYVKHYRRVHPEGKEPNEPNQPEESLEQP